MDQITVVVIGGSGFLGQHIVHYLLKEWMPVKVGGSLEGQCTPDGDVAWVLKEIKVLDIQPYNPAIEPPAGTETSVKYVKCDVSDMTKLKQGITGATVVINCASVTPDYLKDNLGCDQHMRDVNLQGVRNVIEACQVVGIQALVHTSTVAVVMGGKKLVEHTETLTPVSSSGNLVMGEYARVRLAAEQLVLYANGSPTLSGHKLQTVSLRSPLLYGEGDPSFVPMLLRLSRMGANTMPYVGNPEAFLQAAYVGNVAVAHVCAVKTLLSMKNDSLYKCDGLPVYITDDTPPNNLPNLAQPFLTHLGFRPSPQPPYWLLSFLLVLASVWYAFWSLIGVKVRWPSVPTQVLHRYAGTVTVVSRLRAELCLSYYPPFTWEEARGRSVSYYSKNLSL